MAAISIRFFLPQMLAKAKPACGIPSMPNPIPDICTLNLIRSGLHVMRSQEKVFGENSAGTFFISPSPLLTGFLNPSSWVGRHPWQPSTQLWKAAKNRRILVFLEGYEISGKLRFVNTIRELEHLRIWKNLIQNQNVLIGRSSQWGLG